MISPSRDAHHHQSKAKQNEAKKKNEKKKKNSSKKRGIYNTIKTL